MKKHILLVWLLICLGLLFSCASQPPPKTPDFADAKARAVSAMEKAKSVKAEISVKTRYDAAFSVYTEAGSLEAAGSADGIGKYLEAETAFLAAYDEAKAKRDEAQRQLSAARDAIKTVEDEAAEFDREQNEGGRQGVSP